MVIIEFGIVTDVRHVAPLNASGFISVNVFGRIKFVMSVLSIYKLWAEPSGFDTKSISHHCFMLPV